MTERERFEEFLSEWGTEYTSDEINVAWFIWQACAEIKSKEQHENCMILLEQKNVEIAELKAKVERVTLLHETQSAMFNDIF